eukprot:MONOS_531.1-p1 / transcript=MONOS_531.1 / gene=MONOS_531 / organism=Monocercomonoides_exilis_PA203 / gene_product=Cation-Chloride Cotransporter (CCC) Family Protein / transcript_product=Cation-Chloride Cotransporter (CCC) Family Protein / location=Mono_scaffold00008:194801-199576(-) / protein_length=1277 / sequence_SO=supercontig / SO=protein_coding / is_pseudo=false
MTTLFGVEDTTEFAVQKKLESSKQKKGMGMINGVFVSTASNILGTLIYVRHSYIVGEAGLGFSMLFWAIIVFLTYLTICSTSALATNGKIEEGGIYFLVSRNMGPAFGGTIGILFSIATALATAMEILGFSEIFLDVFPFHFTANFDRQLIALAATMFLHIFICIGMKLISKLEIFFLIAQITALLSLLLGTFKKNPELGIAMSSENIRNNFTPGFTGGNNFLMMLGVYVTCYMDSLTGCSRSGELADPSKSLPTGLLLSHTFCSSIYLTALILFASAAPRNVLQGSPTVMVANGWPHPLVCQIGVLIDSLGASMQFLSSAPRVLQAVANDGTVPFLKIFQSKGEPRRAMVFTFIVAAAIICVGELNVATPLISLFFFLCYGSIHLVCFILFYNKDPSFRPTYRFCNKWTSLLGLIMCFVMMFICSWYLAIVVLMVAVGLYLYISKVGVTRNWGDSRSGLQFQAAKNALMSLEQMKHHSRNWRPQLLVCSKIGDVAPCGEEEKMQKRRKKQLEKVEKAARSKKQIESRLSKKRRKGAMKDEVHGMLHSPDEELALGNKSGKGAAQAKLPQQKQQKEGKRGGVAADDSDPEPSDDENNKGFNGDITTSEEPKATIKNMFMPPKQKQEASEADVAASSMTWTSERMGSTKAYIDIMRRRRQSPPPSFFSSRGTSIGGRNTTMSASPGLVVFGHVIPTGDNTVDDETVEYMKASVDAFKTRLEKTIKMKAFVEGVCCESVYSGLSSLMQCTGIGQFRPNVVLLGWPARWHAHPLAGEGFVKTMQEAVLLKKSVIILKCSGGYINDSFGEPTAVPETEAIEGEEGEEEVKGDEGLKGEGEGEERRERGSPMSPSSGSDEGSDETHSARSARSTDQLLVGGRKWPVVPIADSTIDVWWILFDGGLLVLLPTLLKKTAVWKDCKLRIFTVASPQDETDKMKQFIATYLKKLRIEASVEVVVLNKDSLDAYNEQRTVMIADRLKVLHLMEMVHASSAPSSASRSSSSSSLGADKSGFTSVSISSSYGGMSLMDDSSIKKQGSGSAMELQVDPDLDLMRSLSSKKGKHMEGTLKRRESKLLSDNEALEAGAGDVSVKDPPEQEKRAEEASSSTPLHAPVNEMPVLSPGVGSLFDGGETYRTKVTDIFPSIGHKRADESGASEKAEDELQPVQTQRIVFQPYKSSSSASSFPEDSTWTLSHSSSPVSLHNEATKKELIDSAVRLNQLILESSSNAALVLVNLPHFEKLSISELDYLEYVNAMTEGLSRTVLIRGSGEEVVTHKSA